MGEGLVVKTQSGQQVGYAGWGNGTRRAPGLKAWVWASPPAPPSCQQPLLPPTLSPCHEPKLVTTPGKFPMAPGDVPRLWGCSSRKHLGPARLLLPPCSLVLLEVPLLFLLSVVCWSRGMAEQQQRLPGMKWGQGKGQGSCRWMSREPPELCGTRASPRAVLTFLREQRFEGALGRAIKGKCEPFIMTLNGCLGLLSSSKVRACSPPGM